MGWIRTHNKCAKTEDAELQGSFGEEMLKLG